MTSINLEIQNSNILDLNLKNQILVLYILEYLNANQVFKLAGVYC